MKKFNYKSRKGFTLIELLVVIGILAVLAAIAIPSVAGLIDRANVSADDTNANEMTNAVERFTSEYELFCQDIASGRFNPDDLDGAQSRVYNVTLATSRDDITSLESDTGFSDRKINKDTKYPENIMTIKAVVENYTKTSSATFEPKQSDMHFYYSPDCGVVVFGEASETITEELTLALNKKIVSGKNAKGQTLDGTTTWINLTVENEAYETANITVHNGKVIPEGATYFDYSTNTTLIADDNFPETSGVNDVYTYDDYKYTFEEDVAGWHAVVNDKTKTTYGVMLHSINNTDITSTKDTFKSCSQLVELNPNFRIPSNVVSTHAMFSGCTNLITIPAGMILPSKVETTQLMFGNCRALKSLPSTFSIPSSVTDMSKMFSQCRALEKLPENLMTNCHASKIDNTFAYCASLTYLPKNFKLPEEATDFNHTFYDCRGLKALPSNFKLPSNTTSTYSMFMACVSLTTIPSSLTLPNTVTNASAMFWGCTELKSIPNTFKIPDGVTQMYGMFADCTSLETIPNDFTVPAGVSDIKNLLKSCRNLKNTTITINGTITNYINAFNSAGSEEYPIFITGSSPQLSQIANDPNHSSYVIVK